MKKNQNKVKFLVQSAIIAALYIILTFVARIFGLDSGAIQVRISESLIALLFFTPAAIPGLTVGCFLSNLITGCLWQDVIFGTLATLLGALGALAFVGLRGRLRILATLPTVLANGIIIPFVLRLAYGLADAWWIFALSVTAGEVVSATILGALLLPVLDRLPFLARKNRA